MLRKEVVDGGLAARGRVEAEARAADDLEVTFPTYVALAAWGRAGLDLIVQIALEGHTVKSKSAALTLFNLLATNGIVPKSEEFQWVGGGLADLVNSKLDAETIRLDARHALNDLILSLSTDDILIPISQSFMQLDMLSPDLAKELVVALSAKWLRFGPPALAEYRLLIDDKPNDEPSFQSFFCRFPQLLDPMAVQVWSQPDFHGTLEPDFVVRRADNSYLVVEIECPRKLLMTKAGQLSREAIHAEKQAVDYENFLSERVAEARTHFPSYSRADCLAVVGLESSLTSEQRTNLERTNSRRQNVRIVGFDWLLERAMTVVSNVGEGAIKVIERHRIV
jgi:hypothetical protein